MVGCGEIFANWIKDRIEKYGFIENFDYFIAIPNSGDGLVCDKTGKNIKSIAKFGDGEIPLNKPKIKDPKTGRVLAREYIISVDMAKEYRKLLSLIKKDFTRNYMYEEILLIIGAFETGLAGEIEKKFKKLKRHLTQKEFEKIFEEFSSQRNWKVYQKRARNIMATYDEELRNIKHPKLIDYKKEFSQEDIQKLIGNEKYNQKKISNKF